MSRRPGGRRRRRRRRAVPGAAAGTRRLRRPGPGGLRRGRAPPTPAAGRGGALPVGAGPRHELPERVLRGTVGGERLGGRGRGRAPRDASAVAHVGGAVEGGCPTVVRPPREDPQEEEHDEGSPDHARDPSRGDPGQSLPLIHRRSSLRRGSEKVPGQRFPSDRRRVVRRSRLLSGPAASLL